MIDLYSPGAISLDKPEDRSTDVGSGGARPLPFELLTLSAIIEMLSSYVQLPTF